MPKYQVVAGWVLKISEGKTYRIGEEIDLSIREALLVMPTGFIRLLTIGAQGYREGYSQDQKEPWQ